MASVEGMADSAASGEGNPTRGGCPGRGRCSPPAGSESRPP